MEFYTLVCPSCGASLSVLPGAEKATCEYCLSTFNIDNTAEKEAMRAQQNAEGFVRAKKKWQKTVVICILIYVALWIVMALGILFDNDPLGILAVVAASLFFIIIPPVMTIKYPADPATGKKRSGLIAFILFIIMFFAGGAGLIAGAGLAVAFNYKSHNPRYSSSGDGSYSKTGDVTAETTVTENRERDPEYTISVDVDISDMPVMPEIPDITVYTPTEVNIG